MLARLVLYHFEPLYQPCHPILKVKKMTDLIIKECYFPIEMWKKFKNACGPLRLGRARVLFIFIIFRLKLKTIIKLVE
jgi:hypothetical protein